MALPLAAISWSGGKDSCAAYCHAVKDVRIVAALTMFDEAGRRSRSHGLRFEVVSAQTQRLGLETIAGRCSWRTYDRAFDEALVAATRLHVTHVVFGDILFEEHRQWAATMCARRGLTAIEPLWGRSTDALYREFLTMGGRARIVTIRAGVLDDSYLGRELEFELLEEFAARNVDPCGERGEYHTLVTACPAFSSPLRVRTCGRAVHGGCVAEDLMLDE